MNEILAALAIALTMLLAVAVYWGRKQMKRAEYYQALPAVKATYLDLKPIEVRTQRRVPARLAEKVEEEHHRAPIAQLVHRLQREGLVKLETLGPEEGLFEEQQVLEYTIYAINPADYRP